MRAFTWGLDMVGALSATGGVGALLQIDDLVAGKTMAASYDGNGNLASLVNMATGALEAAYEYDPSGILLRCEGSYAKSNPFRFSSKWQDDETGLVNYGARYYSSSLGRFINRDPMGEAGGLNLYGFCGNDGVNHSDVLGYSWLSSAFKRLGNWISDHKQIVAAAIGIAASWALIAYAPSSWGLVKAGGALTLKGAATAGALGGGVSSTTGVALSGGSLTQALRAGVIGAAIGGVAAYAGASIVADHLPTSLSFIQSSSITQRAAGGFIGGAVSGGLSTAIYGGRFARNVLTSALSDAAFSGTAEAAAVLYQGLRIAENPDAVQLPAEAGKLQDIELGDFTVTKDMQISAFRGFLRGQAILNSIGSGSFLIGAAVGAGLGYAIGRDGTWAAVGALAGGIYGLYTSGADVHARAAIALGEGNATQGGLRNVGLQLGGALAVKLIQNFTGIETLGALEPGLDGFGAGATFAVRPVLFGAEISSLDSWVSGMATYDFSAGFRSSYQFGLVAPGSANSFPLWTTFRGASRIQLDGP